MRTRIPIEFSLVSLLRQSAAQKGLTIDAIARLSGIPIGTLQKVMAGAVDPRWSTVFRLANALEVDLSTLFAQHLVAPPSKRFLRADVVDFHSRLQAVVAKAGGPKEAARRTSISLASVYNYVSLKSWPQTDWVLKLCEAADVAPGWLFGRDSEMTQAIPSPEPVERLARAPALPTPTTLGFRRYGKSQRIAPNPDAVQSAEAFKLAIIALPVGKDIRARLTAKLDEHIALLREGIAA